jgi:hypothetical protein
MPRKFPNISCPKCGKCELKSLTGGELVEGEVVCGACGHKPNSHELKQAFFKFAGEGLDKLKKKVRRKDKFGF